ncbi:hypothetical protein BC628DRAFT_1419855 [Trametes gibbosa]|nr:hypothetical protein BC628DRAFT_1419855 [Trametes gibbosa]
MQPNRNNTVSPFIAPCASPGALPQGTSDAEWNFDALALPSRTNTPALSAGRSTPQGQVSMSHEQFQCLISLINSSRAGSSSDGGSANNSPAIPSLTSFSPSFGQVSLSRPGTPDPSKRKRIPRPPNAFMLYRSHLLQTRQIPPGVEHRQQNISRVAGESWNMLQPEQKKVWHDKAKEVLNAHMAKHPDYKFSPERKAARRKTPLDPDTPAMTGEDYIRSLRERYLGLKGPAPKPSRQRKPKSRRGVEASQFPSISLPCSLRASPSASPDISQGASAPPSISSSPVVESCPAAPASAWNGNDVWASFRQASQKDQEQHFDLPRSQGSIFGDDATPKNPTFGETASPAQSKFNFPPMLGYPGYTMDESHLGLDNMSLSGQAGAMAPRGPSDLAAPAQSDPYPLDPMWLSMINESFDPTGAADPSGSGTQDDRASSPFASGQCNNLLDFDNIDFPVFPRTE